MFIKLSVIACAQITAYFCIAMHPEYAFLSEMHWLIANPLQQVSLVKHSLTFFFIITFKIQNSCINFNYRYVTIGDGTSLSLSLGGECVSWFPFPRFSLLFETPSHRPC